MMNCICCSSDTKVVNSRPQKRINGIWRRRQCLLCNAIFTSIEKADLTGSIAVQSQKAIQPFNRDKLFLSIYESCKHRPKAVDEASGLTDTVISKLLPKTKGAVIEVEQIKEVALKSLKNFDRAAFTYYQAYHSPLDR